ncbi:hypothetical protein H2198_008366 [Neophaeococcomyces mojaviensis]|uniref:Uncharacterized protein n=1 Tax=Neophaeococcomyces mojaviensis TaxID=3383035 RepID=A0ACC2ZXF3_9EURO|nr:hypothetical protein H2198_008366 [Knufia sp. JES_112]
MIERCPRQHRIGETCGAKLVAHEKVDAKQEPCKVCQEIQVKRRRLQRLEENIVRWSPEGERFAASLERAARERNEMKEKMRELESRRMVNLHRDSKDGRGVNLPGSVQETPSSYTWSSSSSPGYTPPSQMSSGYGDDAISARQPTRLPPIRTELAYRARNA